MLEFETDEGDWVFAWTRNQARDPGSKTHYANH